MSKRDCLDAGHEWRTPPGARRHWYYPDRRQWTWLCRRCGFLETTDVKKPPPTRVPRAADYEADSYPVDHAEVLELTTQPARRPAVGLAVTPRPRLAPTDVISVLVRSNPRKLGTRAHRAYDLYRDGMSVADFFAAGGTASDLRWDVKHDNVAVGPVSAELGDPASPKKVTTALYSGPPTAV